VPKTSITFARGLCCEGESQTAVCS